MINYLHILPQREFFEAIDVVSFLHDLAVWWFLIDHLNYWFSEQKFFGGMVTARLVFRLPTRKPALTPTRPLYTPVSLGWLGKLCPAAWRWWDRKSSWDDRKAAILHRPLLIKSSVCTWQIHQFKPKIQLIISCFYKQLPLQAYVFRRGIEGR